jgi:hypothetical protein
MSRAAAGGSMVVVFLTALSSRASAQAFLPNQGEGSVGVLYQNTLVNRHVFGDGSRVDAGQIKADGILVDVTYGLTDKMAISLNIPFLAAKYSGTKPHLGSLVDDGQYHSGFQDLRFDLRYNLATGPIAITPFVGTIVPSHDYQYFGHGAIGRNLKEVQIGVAAARLLDPLVPGAFIQARYTYGFIEKPLDVSHNRSILDIELGYFVNPRIRVFGLAMGQITHGGIELTRLFPADLTPDQFLHHDHIGRVNLLDAGGGLQVSVTPAMDLFGSVVHTLSGTNGHALTYSLTIGASWSFRSRSAAKPRAENSLVRCLCEKGM